MSIQPTFGLVLGGGGARGGAHVGVLRVLDEVGFKPDVVTGTSIGGMIGAFVGAGWSVDRIERLIYETPFNDLLMLDHSGQGLVDNVPMEEELRRHFGNGDLRDLPTPTAFIAADVANGDPVLIDHGPIVKAVMATTAVPGLFPPISWGDRLLVDGGVVSNVPTQAAYTLGADRLIAVDVAGYLDLGLALSNVGTFSKRLQRILYWLLDLSNRQAVFDVFIRSNILSYRVLTEYELAAYPPDIFIQPDVGPIGILSMERMRETIVPGEEAARQVLPEIRRLMQLETNERRFIPRTPPLVRIVEEAAD